MGRTPVSLPNIFGPCSSSRAMISRAGHAQMRRALYMPALVASRHDPAVKAFGDRLRATGMAPKAVIGACMHKLAILIYGVLRSGSRSTCRSRCRNLTFMTVSDPDAP
ncbi:transposase [Aquabacterium sp. A7-Y]|uniref:transposase n=1 Tax=Aquabacterium sp. A7-Y TaxID=1349605 RepID=UPI0039FC8E7F